MKTRLKNTGNFRNMLTLVAAVAVICSIQSCEQYEITYPEDEVGYVSYSASIQPIFNSDCTLCHSGSQSPNLSEGASYASLSNNGYINTDNPEESLLYTTLMGSHSSYTNARNKGMILEWIEAGAPND
jgi:hypothetical protein